MCDPMSLSNLCYHVDMIKTLFFIDQLYKIQKLVSISINTMIIRQHNDFFLLDSPCIKKFPNLLKQKTIDLIYEYKINPFCFKSKINDNLKSKSYLYVDVSRIQCHTPYRNNHNPLYIINILNIFLYYLICQYGSPNLTLYYLPFHFRTHNLIRVPSESKLHFVIQFYF